MSREVLMFFSDQSGAWYDAVHPSHVADARAAGGVDVSHDQRAWADYERQLSNAAEAVS